MIVWRFLKRIWHPFSVAFCWLTQYDSSLREKRREGYSESIKRGGRTRL